MKTFLTIIVTAVLVSALFLLTARYKPNWLRKLEYDNAGFPRIKKEGDKFLLNNTIYIYQNGAWVVFTPPPPPPNGGEQQKIYGLPDYSNVELIVVGKMQTGTGVICFANTPGKICDQRIRFKGSIYTLISSTPTQCCYKKVK